MTGKIMKGIGGFYYVYVEGAGLYECRAKGIFRNKKVKPNVGDIVDIDVISEEEKTGNLTVIHKRKNQLIRPMVANVDQALVIFAIHEPEPNFQLLNRFLIMMEKQQVPVIICFNKADLAGEEEMEAYRAVYEKAGYPVRIISAKEEDGVEAVRSLMRGKTTVLAGPSGVGKSTLTNAIHPQASMETGDISRKIERGKHTTRHSELFFLEEGTYMMDTPGFSSIFPPDMEAEELKGYFPEFARFEDGCRFLGCVHVGERDCGVKDAVNQGEVSKSRYENYVLMYEELKNRRRY